MAQDLKNSRLRFFIVPQTFLSATFCYQLHNSSIIPPKQKSKALTAKSYIETTNKTNSKMAEVLVAATILGYAKKIAKEYAKNFAKVAVISGAKGLIRKKVRCVQ